MLRLVDIFAGCGGMTHGFLGPRGPDGAPVFEVVHAVESNLEAAETYRLNIGHDVETRPIEEVPNEDFPAADVVIGGPPCQGFSALNRKRDGDHRRRLWEEYARALEATGADYFVMENVPQLLTSPEFADFKAWLGAEWKVEVGILLAADYGIPQMRKRAFAVGSRRGTVALPAPTHADHKAPSRLLDRELLRWVTVGDAIGDLPKPDDKNWHRARNPSEVSVLRYKRVPPGGNRFDLQRSLDKDGLGDLLPPCWRRKTSGTVDVFGRMAWDLPAPTIRTEFYKPEKGRYLHPEQHRPITVREGAILMGLDDFTFPEHQALHHVGRQIGNAVPPLLAQRIAEAISADAAAQRAVSTALPQAA